VLEFDHVAEKSHDVSTMLGNGYSWRAILEEIGKCEVRLRELSPPDNSKAGAVGPLPP
jgi:hypothetical protein